MSDSLLQGIRQLSGGGIDLSKYTMTYKTGEQRVSESIDNKKWYIYSYSFSAFWFTGARFSWSIYDYDSRSYLVKREDCGSTNVLIFTDGNKYRIFHSSRVYSNKGDNYSFGDSFDVTSSSILVHATSGIGNSLHSSVTLAPKIENVATAIWITFLKALSLVLSNLSSFNPFFSFERKSERKEKDNMSDIYTWLYFPFSFNSAPLRKECGNKEKGSII